jgi:hypothetical protein
MITTCLTYYHPCRFGSGECMLSSWSIDVIICFKSCKYLITLLRTACTALRRQTQGTMKNMHLPVVVELRFLVGRILLCRSVALNIVNN